MKIVAPENTKRYEAFQMWMNAPMPMCTLIKTFDIAHLVKVGRINDFKLNALLMWCIGHAASQVEEFYLLPLNGQLALYDKLALNAVIKCNDNSIKTCDIPYSPKFIDFYDNYLKLTQTVFETACNFDLSPDYMVIGTSALINCEIDGAVNMYCGVFNNPFLIWGKYSDSKSGQTLSISFQFHHTQFDGLEAGDFLNLLQNEINTFEVD